MDRFDVLNHARYVSLNCRYYCCMTVVVGTSFNCQASFPYAKCLKKGGSMLFDTFQNEPVSYEIWQNRKRLLWHIDWERKQTISLTITCTGRCCNVLTSARCRKMVLDRVGENYWSHLEVGRYRFINFSAKTDNSIYLINYFTFNVHFLWLVDSWGNM